MKLRVWCPAKVNLFLSVGPKEHGGYHPIRTVFQAIGLYDELLIETGAERTTIESDWESLPTTNTISRTLGLLAEVVELPPIRIHLTKCIPSQSGLGGGSSDAAGLLRAVPRLLRHAPPEAELASIAIAIGADVPFFLVGGKALGEGYGERLKPLPDSPREWLAVARPDIGCPTGEMYAKLDEKEFEWRRDITSDALYNDFERVAPCECLDLVERLLSLGAKDAGLSGSGSAVFGRFKGEAEARSACEKMPGNAWLAQTLTRSESLRIEVE